MSECQNYWHTEWLTSMGKTAPPWGRRPVPEEDNLSSTKSICPHESFVFWEIIREFTHSNSSFEYVSDFSNFVFGDVVLFSKCLSHDFFAFSFAFCFFSQPLCSVAVSFPTTSSLSFGILLCLIVTFPKALNLILSWIFSNLLYFSSMFVLSFLITSLNSLQYFAVSSVYTDQLVPGKGALFQTFSTWHPNTFCPYCIYWPSTAFYWPSTTKYQSDCLMTGAVFMILFIKNHIIWFPSVQHCNWFGFRISL